jgi:hypothetical protein
MDVDDVVEIVGPVVGDLAKELRGEIATLRKQVERLQESVTMLRIMEGNRQHRELSHFGADDDD